jgi:hypothetical protein
MSEHIGELAELYALGALEPAEAAQVDAHAAGCASCLRRLGEAEDSVTAMMRLDAQSQPSNALRARMRRAVDPHDALRVARPARTRPLWLSLAAAVVIALLPAGYLLRQNMAQREALRAAASTNSAIVAQLARGPLNMVNFTNAEGVPVDARVMYNRTGSWYLVVVKHPLHAMDVAYVHPDGSMEKIGQTSMQGDMGVAVMPIPHKMDKLALLDGHAVVAEALLLY